MGNQKWSVGVLGATGQVGREVCALLAERKFPCETVQLFASSESEGEEDGDGHVIQVARGTAYEGLDLLFAAVPPAVAAQQIPQALERNVKVIDFSTAGVQREGVPLVVPEINADLCEDAEESWVASPMGPVIGVSMVLDALRGLSVPVRVSLTVFMSASHKGRKGIEELAAQTIGLLNQSEFPTSSFPVRLAFNLIPLLGEVEGPGADSDYERLLGDQLRNILEEEELAVEVTGVMVPVFTGIACDIRVTFEDDVKEADIRKCLGDYDGIGVLDAPENNLYPTFTDVPETNEVWVGRLRSPGPRSCSLWIAYDNVRKGSALNGVQIAEAWYAQEIE